MEEPEAETQPRGQKKKGGRAGYSGVALRELRRARRTMEQATDAEAIPPEAAAALQIANALALLDLADAVRGRSADAVVDEEEQDV